MTTRSQLVGYIRKYKNGVSLRLTIDVEAFATAAKVEAKDGRQFVNLVCNADKVRQIIEGQREVSSICQLVEED